MIGTLITKLKSEQRTAGSTLLFQEMKQLLRSEEITPGTRWRAAKCYVVLIYRVESWTLETISTDKIRAFAIYNGCIAGF